MDEMDGTMDPLMPGDEELQRRLEAYAEERLRPDPLARARARARVVAEAAAAPTVGPGRPAPVERPLQSRRRLLVGLLAASVALVVLVGGAAAMSGPGGALYGARLWFEEVTLPSEPGARAAAELRRIEARFDEVEAATARGDEGALAAALAAYEGTVDEALGSVPAELREQHLEDVLSKHLVLLDGLLETAPAPAIEGLRNAIEKSGKALDRLDERGPDASPGGRPSEGPGASPGGGRPSTKPDASPANGKPSVGPGASPDATKSQKPDASAKP